MPMVQELYAIFGVPKCALDGCWLPGVVHFKFTDENGSVWLDLCPGCLTEIKKCLEEVSSVMEERRQTLGHAERPSETLPFSEHENGR